MTTVFSADLEAAETPGDTRKLFEKVARLFGPRITEACGITPETEYQLDNFGPGSAWCMESPFDLRVTYHGGRTWVEVVRI